MHNVTKEWLKEKKACNSGLLWWEEKGSPADAKTIIDMAFKDNKSNYANWLVTRLMNKKQGVQYAIFAAEKVLHIFEGKYSKDDRPRKSIEAAKAYLKRPCEKTKAAAAAAAWCADTAAAAAWHATAVAWHATAAAWHAAAAAWHAAAAADAAWHAAAAAWRADAAYAVRDTMLKEIIEYGLELLTKGNKYAIILR